jgi:hypothetical protein
MSAEQATPNTASVAAKRARKSIRKKTVRNAADMPAADPVEEPATPPLLEDNASPARNVMETATVGADVAAELPRKNKRRRRKGKGDGVAPAGQSEAKPLPPVPSEAAPKPPRANIDPESLAKSAWKIYLAEISEEGVALIGDNDARDLARRCFRLAEIFMEEQSRRR